MSYQELGHLLFPLWLCGCGIALVLNLRDWRMFGLTAFYFVFAIALFQLKFDGMASVYGWRWYVLEGGIVQPLVISMTYITASRASQAVRRCGLGIMAVCTLYLPFYVLHHPLPRDGYFVGVNSFQALQILSLIGFSSFWGYAARALQRAFSRKKGSQPWERIAHSGQI